MIAMEDWNSCSKNPTTSCYLRFQRKWNILIYYSYTILLFLLTQHMTVLNCYSLLLFSLLFIFLLFCNYYIFVIFFFYPALHVWALGNADLYYLLFPRDTQVTKQVDFGIFFQVKIGWIVNLKKFVIFTENNYNL